MGMVLFVICRLLLMLERLLLKMKRFEYVGCVNEVL